jgi:hypothetical protein
VPVGNLIHEDLQAEESDCTEKVPALFDHLVGEQLHLIGDGETECLSGLEVDDQFELHHLLHREIGGLLALEDTAGVDADLAKQLRNIRSVAYQTAGRGELAIRTDRRNGVAKCQRAELLAARNKVWVGADHQRTGPQLNQRRKGRIEIVIGAGMRVRFEPSLRFTAVIPRNTCNSDVLLEISPKIPYGSP